MVESPQVHGVTVSLLLEETGSSLLLDDDGSTLLDDCVGVSDDVTGASSLDDSACSLLEDFSSGSTSLLLEEGAIFDELDSSLALRMTSDEELLEDCFSLELDALLLDETEELDLSRLSSLWMAEEEDSGSSSIAT